MPSLRARAPRKTPSQERSALTVDAILEAATRIFSEQGFHAATTGKVAELAGVSVGSLYQYFPNKLALLAGTKKRFIAGLFARMDAVLAEAPDLETGIRAAIRVNLETAANARSLCLCFGEELPARLDTRETQLIDAPHLVMLQRFFTRHRVSLPLRDPGLAALVVAEMVDAVTRAALRERPRDLTNGVLETELLSAVLLYLQCPTPSVQTEQS